MDKSDVRSALFNYPRLEHYIKADKEQLIALEAIREKAGSSIAKIPENPKSRSEVLMDNMERYDLALKSLEMHQYQLWIVNKFLENIDEIVRKHKKEHEDEKAKQLIIDRFVKRYSQTKMEVKYDCDRTQIYRNINRYIDWFVEYYNESLLKDNHD